MATTPYVRFVHEEEDRRLRLGYVLQMERLKCGMSESEIAEKAEIGVVYMRKIEWGVAHNVKDKQIDRIVRALNLTHVDLEMRVARVTAALVHKRRPSGVWWAGGTKNKSNQRSPLGLARSS